MVPVSVQDLAVQLLCPSSAATKEHLTFKQTFQCSYFVRAFVVLSWKRNGCRV